MESTLYLKDDLISADDSKLVENKDNESFILQSQEEESLKDQLLKNEEEIATLRKLLNAKLLLSQDLKRQLGITAIDEIKEDIMHGLNVIKESNTFKTTSTVMSNVKDKASQSLYSTSSNLSQKFEMLRNSNTIKSFEGKIEKTCKSVKTEKTNFKPGDKIFAKVKGFVYWPARINPIPAEVIVPPNKVPIFFYGTHEVYFISTFSIWPYDDKTKARWGKPRSRAHFNEAMDEIENNPTLLQYGVDPLAIEYLGQFYQFQQNSCEEKIKSSVEIKGEEIDNESKLIKELPNFGNVSEFFVNNKESAVDLKIDVTNTTEKIGHDDSISANKIERKRRKSSLQMIDSKDACSDNIKDEDFQPVKKIARISKRLNIKTPKSNKRHGGIKNKSGKKPNLIVKISIKDIGGEMSCHDINNIEKHDSVELGEHFTSIDAKAVDEKINLIKHNTQEINEETVNDIKPRRSCKALRNNETSTKSTLKKRKTSKKSTGSKKRLLDTENIEGINKNTDFTEIIKDETKQEVKRLNCVLSVEDCQESDKNNRANEESLEIVSKDELMSEACKESEIKINSSSSLSHDVSEQLKVYMEDFSENDKLPLVVNDVIAVISIQDIGKENSNQEINLDKSASVELSEHLTLEIDTKAVKEKVKCAKKNNRNIAEEVDNSKTVLRSRKDTSKNKEPIMTLNKKKGRPSKKSTDYKERLKDNKNDDLIDQNIKTTRIINSDLLIIKADKKREVNDDSFNSISIIGDIQNVDKNIEMNEVLKIVHKDEVVTELCKESDMTINSLPGVCQDVSEHLTVSLIDLSGNGVINEPPVPLNDVMEDTTVDSTGKEPPTEEFKLEKPASVEVVKPSMENTAKVADEIVKLTFENNREIAVAIDEAKTFEKSRKSKEKAKKLTKKERKSSKSVIDRKRNQIHTDSDDIIDKSKCTPINDGDDVLIISELYPKPRIPQNICNDPEVIIIEDDNAIVIDVDNLGADMIKILHSLNSDIRSSLTLGHEDYNKCLGTFKRLCTMNIDLISLVSVWQLMDTVKKCRRYKRNESIKNEAQLVYKRFLDIYFQSSNDERLKAQDIFVKCRHEHSKLDNSINSPSQNLSIPSSVADMFQNKSQIDSKITNTNPVKTPPMTMKSPNIQSNDVDKEKMRQLSADLEAKVSDVLNKIEKNAALLNPINESSVTSMLPTEHMPMINMDWESMGRISRHDRHKESKVSYISESSDDENDVEAIFKKIENVKIEKDEEPVEDSSFLINGTGASSALERRIESLFSQNLKKSSTSVKEPSSTVKKQKLTNYNQRTASSSRRPNRSSESFSNVIISQKKPTDNALVIENKSPIKVVNDPIGVESNNANSDIYDLLGV